MPNLSITISSENFIRVDTLSKKEKEGNVSATIDEILDGFFGEKERKERRKGERKSLQNFIEKNGR